MDHSIFPGLRKRKHLLAGSRRCEACAWEWIREREERLSRGRYVVRIVLGKVSKGPWALIARQVGIIASETLRELSIASPNHEIFFPGGGCGATTGAGGVRRQRAPPP